MLHVLFASAQLWGSYNFYKMMKKQERIIARLEETGGEEGTVPKQEQDSSSGSSKNSPVLVSSIEGDSIEHSSQDGSQVELTENLQTPEKAALRS